MKVLQTRLFSKTVKKLSSRQKAVLDDEIRKIIGDPSIGQEKRGALKGIFVHKFKIHNSLFLLAYRCDSRVLELIMLGPHENYYRDLDNYLKG
ncbi:MAG TPA: type II toxin-antitoxin system RelE/ParE family toxin [Candidatus Sabulitectum sp.]|nr:type II toxin-antitoxin system RelE/ParE family toxin [Candidatus Sabulitectum sp.]HPJ29305.1 type II toxin-antitoxin system RelE/ParE family toxin [Candidatus Sabulitectum sp.]HPR22267.1 type II toxin-antitoxin system RelE/ParE family toxin [Candidatus Sabulitectum sp.]